jgi:hypothetical protein
MGHIPRKQQYFRKSGRTRAFAAGLLARDGHSEPLSCLIRDISPEGAQIRINAAQPIPASGYMINLKTRSAYHAHAVWRRGSLSGLSLGEEHAINDLLPADLKFLRSFFIEAKLRQVDQLTSQGLSRAAALRRFGITEERYHQAREIFSP